MKDIVYKKESYNIVGACFEVYKRKRFGFTEAIYQECLAIEFDLRSLPFVEQPRIQLDYKGKILRQYFRPDFVCYETVIVEIKATSDLVESNKSQVLNYLNATGFELALLVNFGHYPMIEYIRIANTNMENKEIGRIRKEIRSWDTSDENP